MKPIFKAFLQGLFLYALACSGQTWAQTPTFDNRIEHLALNWAHINYEMPDKTAQAVAAHKLAVEAGEMAHESPTRAEPLVWEAIALSTEAGARDGMGALGRVKQAKGLLEKAEMLNPNALGDGSVYTSLGSLYAQVPGFPIGFGDPAKARAYLEKAVAVNPTGIDPNYFYGDFLFRQGDYAKAAKVLTQALNAPARPHRDVANRGRRAEAARLLAKAKAKL